MHSDDKLRPLVLFGRSGCLLWAGEQQSRALWVEGRLTAWQHTASAADSAAAAVGHGDSDSVPAAVDPGGQ